MNDSNYEELKKQREQEAAEKSAAYHQKCKERADEIRERSKIRDRLQLEKEARKGVI